MPVRLCEKIKQIAREPWHRYVLPGYDAEDGFPEYRFEWELFGEAAFYQIANMSLQLATFCCFSRAVLSDTDLQSLINEPAIASSSSTDLVLDVFETEVKGDQGGCDSDEEIAREMAALDLPTSFGDSSREKRSCDWCERKYRSNHIRKKSPHHECLSDYLFFNGSYLERKSWFHDYPESFSTAQVAEKFDKYTDWYCAPYALLKDHKQASAFFGVSYAELGHEEENCSGCWFHLKKNPIMNQTKESGVDYMMEGSPEDDRKRYSPGEDKYCTKGLFKTDSDWNSLYLKHKGAVESRIGKDYEKYTNESQKRRCLEFPDKLALVGLAYKKHDSSSDEGKDNCLKTGVPELRRQPGFHIADIHYDFQIPHRFIQKNGSHLHTNENVDRIRGFAVADAESVFDSSDSTVKDFDFDFGYNDERDKRLLAKNALKIFAHDKDMPKYYNQRFRLFSKLNEGILMDREGWYSVTPERIAAHIADRVVIMKDAIVMDGFAGVGGNCIQFALKGAYVIALDMDPVRLRCAKRNAEIYGVADRINFICIDFFNFCKFHCDKVKQLKMEVRKKQKSTSCLVGHNSSKPLKRQRVREEIADDLERIQKAVDGDEFVVEKAEDRKVGRTVFFETDTEDEDDFGIVVDNCHFMPVFDAVLLSPPWGGPSYLKSKLFSLKSMEPRGDRIFRITRKLTHNIAYFLPRQTDVKELVQLSKKTGGLVEIEQAEVNRKVKAITAYFGELSCDASW